MKSILIALFIILPINAAFADACHDRFADLLINGSGQTGPVRLHITQEIVGGKTSTNYHHSDGEGNGMTEMIDPAGEPWSLFLGDKMYMSSDKGETWKFINSYDAKKSRADMKVTLTKDVSEATDVLCREEKINGVVHKVVEGKYNSSSMSGTAVHNIYWVNQHNGWIVKSYSHLKSSNFESKTTQVIEPAPELRLPEPE